MKNAKITDLALDKIRDINGVYAHHISRFATKLAHKKRGNMVDITVSLDAEQLGCNGDVRCIDPQMQMHDELKLIPVIVFVDPSEFKS